MAVVGFGFKKIEIERMKPSTGKINIRNNIAIKELEEYKPTGLDKKSKGMKFVFEFASDYTPSIGVIKLVGEVFMIEPSKKADEVFKSWKKDKRVPKETMTIVLNYALSKSNVEAIALSRDVALPPPMPMPRVSVGKSQQNDYIG